MISIIKTRIIILSIVFVSSCCPKSISTLSEQSLYSKNDSANLIIKNLNKNVTDIAWSRNNQKRKRFVQKELSTIQQPIKERIDIFSFQHNFMIEIKGKSDKIIYITAHYDKTDANLLKVISLSLNGILDDLISWSFLSQGAIDNGSGVSVAIELAKKIKSQNNYYTYRVLLTGSEESGIRGARAHVAKIPDTVWSNVKCCINLDCVGMKNAQHRVIISNDKSGLDSISKNVAIKNNIELNNERMILDFSDHTPFSSTSAIKDISRSFLYNITGAFLPQRSYFTHKKSTSTIFIFNSGISPANPVSQVNALLPIAIIPSGDVHSISDNLNNIDSEVLYKSYLLALGIINEFEVNHTFD